MKNLKVISKSIGELIIIFCLVHTTHDLYKLLTNNQSEFNVSNNKFFGGIEGIKIMGGYAPISGMKTTQQELLYQDSATCRWYYRGILFDSIQLISKDVITFKRNGKLNYVEGYGRYNPTSNAFYIKVDTTAYRLWKRSDAGNLFDGTGNVIMRDFQATHLVF